MTRRPGSTGDDWGSWAEDHAHKLTLGVDATPDERLAWLEAMLELALASGALPRAKDPWGRWDPP